MKFLLKLAFGLFCAGGTAVLVGLMIYKEFHSEYSCFAMSLGALGVLAFFGFLFLTKNPDNEETNILSEKGKK